MSRGRRVCVEAADACDRGPSLYTGADAFAGGLGP